MNVGLFTYDFYPIIGGQGRVVYELYQQNEIQQKINLLIFSPARNNLHHHVTLFEETHHDRLRNIGFSLKVNPSLQALIDTYHLDIAHFQSGPGGLFLLRRLPIPTIFTCHHTYWQQSHYVSGQKWKMLFYLLERAGYSKASAIICDSPSTRAVIASKYRLHHVDSQVIPLGIHWRHAPRPVPETKKDRAVLFVGRIDQRKGLDFLISAFAVLAKSAPDIRLHVVGEGKDRAKLQDYCARHGWNVIFHGYLSDQAVADLAQGVSAQIIPSVFEGFGLVVLEAIAKGLPVIATNVDGIRDMITDGTHGLLVNYGDTQGLAQKIQALLADPDLARRLVKNAYPVLENYTWENTYAQTIQAYERVLSA